MNVGVFNEAVSFFNDWLFNGSSNNFIIFQTQGDLMSFSITGETLCYGFAVASVLLFFITAVWLVKWLINFIMGLSGRL